VQSKNQTMQNMFAKNQSMLTSLSAKSNYICQNQTMQNMFAKNQTRQTIIAKSNNAKSN
jgi:hypothetical protein